MSSVPIASLIVKRLRDTAPAFERRVGGVADFNEKANQEADIDVPMAWVLPLAETARPRTNLGSAQSVREAFAVMVCLDNSVDRQNGLGQLVNDVLRGVRQELFNSLLEWAPLTTVEPIQYIGGRHVTMNRSRLWHQFEFTFSEYVAGQGLTPDGHPVPGATDACVPVIHVEGREHYGGSVETVNLDDKINALLGL